MLKFKNTYIFGIAPFEKISYVYLKIVTLKSITWPTKNKPYVNEK